MQTSNPTRLIAPPCLIAGGAFLLYPTTTLTKGLRMALADSLQKEIKGAPRTSVCSVVKIMANLTKEDAEVLQKALYDRSIKASVLGRALTKEKIGISVSTITRHRNGGCATCASK